MTTDSDMLESLMLRLIQGMEEQNMRSLFCEGWALAFIGDIDGRRSANQVAEHEPRTGPSAQVEAGGDGRDPERRPLVGRTRFARRVFAASKEAREKRHAARRPWSRSRRRRVSRRGWR